jgi:F0F1-type ATP synthase assembly protein I
MGEDGQSSKDKYGAGALFIPAGVLTGIGVGFLLDHLVAGLFIGLGIGFALFGVTAVLRERTGR